MGVHEFDRYAGRGSTDRRQAQRPRIQIDQRDALRLSPLCGQNTSGAAASAHVDEVPTRPEQLEVLPQERSEPVGVWAEEYGVGVVRRIGRMEKQLVIEARNASPAAQPIAARLNCVPGL